MTLAVPSLADIHRLHIERQRRMGAPAPSVVRLDLIRPPEPEPKVEVEPATEFTDLPDFLALSRDQRRATFRKSRARIVLEVASRLSGISIHDLKSERRTADVIIPRQVACWALHRLTPLSLPRIGVVMGGRDHTTILHAVRKIERLRGSGGKVLTLSDEVYSEGRYVIERHGYSEDGDTE